ncbi:unnamed protein product [Pseudo-nitzschia multistriata]|uniref:Uncharacterized protein n=1 Tax=Pseudo-nitzschia multistriata TaxID=183589 RepID=A0A448Z3Y8_9STRA|nr:unnamed protein product [Pseudo-nitzschia multistriata]
MPGHNELPTLAGSNLNATMSKNSLTVTTGPCTSDIVLESMEEYVGCIENVDQQHLFEEGLLQQAARQRKIAMEHGLSEAEAALIRLQMTTLSKGVLAGGSDADGIRSTIENTLSAKIASTQLNDILEQVCGAGDPLRTAQSHGSSCNITMKRPLSVDFCDGVVLPMDTTLPTSLPGNALVASRQRKSARSLVDIAAEDDAYQEEKEDYLTIDEGAIYECAICNDSCSPDVPSRSSNDLHTRKPIFCRMPCCQPIGDFPNDEPQGGKHDNFKVCTACMPVLTVATKDGTSRVGRCPRCREWVSLLTLHSTSASTVVRKLGSSGKCETCQQVKWPLVVDEPATCDACFLAQETSPLIYECEDCHQPQPVQSTLYRSQRCPKTFGRDSFPCNKCERSTHWRLLSDQLPLIPANDIPECWGDELCLELARTRVQIARQGIAKLDFPGRNAMVELAKNEAGCSIM